jgi:hypothetical protein
MKTMSMNKPSKIVLFSFCLFLFSLYGISQNMDSTVRKSRTKPFYAIEANFGVSARIKGSQFEGAFKSINFLYKSLVYGGNFMGGIELNHYFKVGLGLGYFYCKINDNAIRPSGYIINNLTTTTHGLPLFLFIRSNFLNRKVSPYMELKIGNNFLLNKGIAEIMDYHGTLVASSYELPLNLNNGLYLASNIGVSIKTKSKVTINTSIGYQYVSSSIKIIVPFLYNTAMKDLFVPTGETVIDHQFLVNAGISF